MGIQYADGAVPPTGCPHGGCDPLRNRSLPGTVLLILKGRLSHQNSKSPSAAYAPMDYEVRAIGLTTDKKVDGCKVGVDKPNTEASGAVDLSTQAAGLAAEAPLV